jgi:hypothetical protein
MAMTDGKGIGNDDGNCNGNGHKDGFDDVVVMTTDTREDCLVMCQQCAVLWQGQHLASPPWTQGSVHCPMLHHGGATAKILCSISRGRDPESLLWIVFIFIFYNYCSFYQTTLCSPTPFRCSQTLSAH